MADTKFTKGPWSYDEERKHIVVQGDYDVCSLDIGWDEDSEQEIEEMYATANLIAAAPELYEAAERAEFRLESVIEFIERHCSGENATAKRNIVLSIQQELHDALAKARGEAA